MPKKPKVKWCDRTMFLGPYYCLVTTPKLFKQTLKHLGVDIDTPYTNTPTANATCWEFEKDGKHSFIVTLRDWKWKDPIEVAGLIVHEATHIKQYTMRIIGEKDPSIEFEAYMMQNISANLMQCFKDQTK